MARRLALLAALVAAAVLFVPAAAGAAPERQFYVSVGDSYASGYQATGVGTGRKPATASPTRCPGSRPRAVTGSSS